MPNETAWRLPDSHTLLVAAVLAGPAAVMVGTVLAYDANWATIRTHRTELLLGLVPVAFALAPVLSSARHRRRVAVHGGGLLVLLSFISSAGIFFLPTAILMILAARAEARGARAR